MFNIKENRFKKDGIIHYIDEKNNKLMIISSKTGESFIVKIRPNPDWNVKLSSISLEYPYNLEGVHFEIKTSDEKIANDVTNSEAFINMLKEAITIVERWVMISQDLYLLTAKAVAKNEEGEKELQELTNKAVENLIKYPETQDFISAYKMLIDRTVPLI